MKASNAVSLQKLLECLLGRLGTPLEDAERDPAVRVALIQGGGRAFSTGYEVGEARESDRPWSPAADREVARAGPPHAPRFTIEVSVGAHAPATGSGSSKRSAEGAAAAVLMARLEGEA